VGGCAHFWTLWHVQALLLLLLLLLVTHARCAAV
jgi:uncharacterized integral membrane protein